MSLLPLIIIKNEICSYNIHSSERLERVPIKFYLHEPRHKGCDQQQLSWRRFRISSHLALVKSAVYPEDIIAFQDRFRKLLDQRSYSFNRTAVLGVGYQGKHQAALIKYLIHQAIVGTSLSFGSYPQIVSNHIAFCSPTYFASYLSSHFVLMTTSLVAPFWPIS